MTLTTLCLETYVYYACNVGLPQAIGDVISSIGTAAADSIEYRALAWYRSNPLPKQVAIIPKNYYVTRSKPVHCKRVRVVHHLDSLLIRLLLLFERWHFVDLIQL